MNKQSSRNTGDEKHGSGLSRRGFAAVVVAVAGLAATAMGWIRGVDKVSWKEAAHYEKISPGRNE